MQVSFPNHCEHLPRDIVVLATKGTAAEAALKAAGLANLENKTVIDTTNPIADAPPVNGELQYFTSQNESLMERLQRLAAGARFVKSFSCIGNAFMVNPDFNVENVEVFQRRVGRLRSRNTSGIIAARPVTSRTHCRPRETFTQARP